MSSTVITNSARISKDVMVRAFGGKPVRLNAVGDLGDAVEVCGSDSEMTIGFPREDVFPFNRRLFGELEAAYAAGDHGRLGELWDRTESLVESAG